MGGLSGPAPKLSPSWSSSSVSRPRHSPSRVLRRQRRASRVNPTDSASNSGLRSRRTIVSRQKLFPRLPSPIIVHIGRGALWHLRIPKRHPISRSAGA
jgi:hypothetical protein